VQRHFAIINRTINPRPERFAILQILNPQPDASGILSVSLYGDLNVPSNHERYVKPLLANCNRLRKKLPGWVIRVYLSKKSGLSDELVRKGCEVYIMNDDSTGIFWRFLPAAGDKPFLTHDADMLIGEEGRGIPDLTEGVRKWQMSGKKFYRRALGIINHIVPISGGMFGGIARCVPDILQRMLKYDDQRFGADEIFLKREIWPLFRRDGFYSETIIPLWVLIIIVLLVIYVAVKLIT